jgi:enoyl-CoA hydratase/carnithine racemase
MAQESAPRITVTIEAGVADVRLNRPEKLNALDPPMFDALVETGTRLAGDPSVRAVVLSGEGRGFCSGLDFAAFQAMAGPSPESGGGGSRAATRLTDRAPGRIANHAQQAAFTWTELPVPVIAAVHGVALGGGLQIALAADVRMVAPDARLSVLEIRWGLIPDMTGTHMLRRLVPLDVAKELTWTGRMVSGEEAVGLGLATRLADDPRRSALALAAEVAAGNPHAIRAAKQLLNQSGLVSQEQQFQDEARMMGGLIGSPNQQEAVLAFFEKRSPIFADPG